MRRRCLLLLTFLLASGALTPAQGAGTRSQEWQVAAPALAPYTGGPVHTRHLRKCRSHDLHASARTVRSTYAVLGVVRIRFHHCLLADSKGPVALLDTDGQRLSLPFRAASQMNRGAVPPVAPTSSISWGFAWRGSWCGAQAVYVRVAVSGHRRLRVPLPGAKPACATSGARTVVIRGRAAVPGQPVQAAPPEWSALKAKLAVSRTTSGSTIRGLSVTLTNRSPRAIALDPCPNYAMMAASSHASEVVRASSPLAGCPAVPTVVPGNGSKTIRLDSVVVNRKDFGPTGTYVTVTFGIAGLAPAAVRTRLT